MFTYLKVKMFAEFNVNQTEIASQVFEKLPLTFIQLSYFVFHRIKSHLQ